MEQPLVSIITITRNRGNLLGRCIQSILNQTYKNIEYIIVDGASTDNTDDVVACFDDDRLKFVKLESNWPIVETINYGVSISHGQYVTFLDSDDEYLPTKIEEQIELFAKLSPDYGLVYCWMSYFDDKTKELLYVHKSELRGFIGEEVVDVPRVSGTPTYMFRRGVFDELGGWKKKEEIGIVSDWDLAARCCQKYKVDYVGKSLINVYVNHGSLRMTDKDISQDACRRNIQFADYFLHEFSDVFEKYPQKACEHYYKIIVSNLLLGNYKEAFKYYIKINRTKFSCKYILSYPYYLFKHCLYGNQRK